MPALEDFTSKNLRRYRSAVSSTRDGSCSRCCLRNRKVIRLIYNLLWPLGLLLFLPGYLIKMFRRGGYRKKFGQRIGVYDAGVRARLGQQTSIWLHAVSVGEVAIGLKLAS